ncbi:uncharacterized protein LOC105665584 [Ceratitis capitata]|uniref:uncharacterized protein LOC105665584 n=1 Tax=Ceratitis capitata TaxID=7213 RepID=UPI0006189568|nr:uncharacterized protein LOC105665584 [Ceratitis capitata]
MAKFIYTTVVLLLLCIVLMEVNACQIHIRLTRLGQRICELKCRPTGQMALTECYTPTRVFRAVVCPPYCCRLEGSRCRQL